jgi:SSS family solute:Na+ symporter
VQRALGAPNETVARRGSIFASFLKLSPVYLFIIPGMVCFALARSGKVPELTSMIGPDGKAITSVAQGSFPMMVQYLLPPGLRGLVVAGLLSALMGSLAGVFNACSTLFTVDLYSKWKPHATQEQIVRTGRIATTVMVIIALLWIPVIKGATGLYNYLQAVQGYLAPPIFVVFFLGVFFKRLNAKGALWAMIVGFAMGIFRMIVDTPVTLGLSGLENGYTPGSFLWIVNNVYFQYWSVLITIVSAIVMVVVSRMTAEPDYVSLKSLTFATQTKEDRLRTRAGWDRRDVLASAFVLACILGSYLYFRG